MNSSQMDTNVALLDQNAINSILKSYLSSDSFIVKSVDISSAGGDKLLGFLGDHFKLTVKYNYDGRSCYIEFFFKTLPRNNVQRAGYNIQFGLFERETFFYKHIFSQFKQYGESKEWHPKCYYAEGNDLVLENLRFRGFEMRELKHALDKDHALIVMQSLARFHGASIIFEDVKRKENGKTFRIQDFAKELDGGCFKDNHWFNNTVVEALILAGESNKYGKGTVFYEKVRSSWDAIFVKGRKLSDVSDKYYNVITHCDLWNNNMMFRYEKGKPQQCMFVDYQACKVSTPAADIVSFIYLALDKKTRDKCSDELIKSYHRELHEVLKESGINIDDFLPWNLLIKSCEEYRLWGLVQSSVLFQFLFLDESDVMAILKDSEIFEKMIFGSRSEALIKKVNSDDLFRDRVMIIIEELIERYIV